MTRAFSIFAATALLCLFASSAFADETAPAVGPVAQGPAGAIPEDPFPRKFPAPSLEGGIGWLNTSGEITLKDLRGKVVLLDFWTYCCINCIHVLPDLKYLEQKYDKQLVVIGVHSAKFNNEKETENIRQAIVRYEIEHPVINDAEMTVWRKFDVHSWPTLVMIDPEGNYCGFVAGEGQRELLDTVIGKVVEFHRAKKTLDETPIRFDLEREKHEPGPLKYPGKVLADSAGNRLFISDSNHNRIVIASLDGRLIDVVGTGQMGSADGDYKTAQFDHPQGMALVGETLYVADTENHLLRTVDLNTKTVSTLAGTGQQARGREPGGALRTLALNSPWDLVHVDGILYIAMAGPHQLWAHRLGTDRIGFFSGTGREDIIDGPHTQAAYAQTSGMVSDGTFLYVCDSEGSSIRKVSLDPRGGVATIAGTHDLPRGRSLFEFGDVDGVGERARLQHPLGIALAGQTLFIADTYNHKIKTIDLKTRRVTSWLGDSQRGDTLDPPRFSEPSGLAIVGNQMFIADTNNHRIVVADLMTKALTPFVVQGLEPPAPVEKRVAFEPPKDVIDVVPQTLAADKTLPVRVSITLPEGYKLNPDSPVAWRVQSEAPQTLVAAEQLGTKQEAQVLPEGEILIDVPLQSATGQATLLLTVTYGYCRDGVGGVCKLGVTSWKVPVNLAAQSDQRDVKLSAVRDK